MPPPAGPPPGFVSGHLPPPSPSMLMHRLPPPMMPPPGYTVLMPPPPGDPSHDSSAIACPSLLSLHVCLASLCRAGHVCCTILLTSVYVPNAAIDTGMHAHMCVCVCVPEHACALGLEVCMQSSRYNRGCIYFQHGAQCFCNTTIALILQQNNIVPASAVHETMCTFAKIEDTVVVAWSLQQE